MIRHLPRLLLVLCGLFLVDGRAFGQGASGLPDPMSTTWLEEQLDRCGGAGTAEASNEMFAAPFDRYQEAFRALRNDSIERWLEERRGRSLGFLEAPPIEEARSEARTRRDLANRIAELDDRLMAELLEAGIDDDVIRRVSDARRQARAHAIIGRRHSSGTRVDVRKIRETAAEESGTGPQWAADALFTSIVDRHSNERADRLEALARSAIDLPVERARLLAAIDDGRPALETATPEAVQAWFETRRSAEFEAAAGLRDLQASIVAADNETLARLVATAGGDFGKRFRELWMESAHRGLFPDRESPLGLLRRSRDLAANGDLDESTAAAIDGIEATWSTEHRAIEERMLAATVEATRRGERTSGGFMAMLVPDAASKEGELDALRRRRSEIDARARTALVGLGDEAIKEIAERKQPRTIDFGDGAIEVGGAATFVVAGEAIGDGLGEMIGDAIAFTLDDLDLGGDNAVFIGDVAGGPGMGGGGLLPRPMDAASFDALCRRLSIEDADRSIVDVLFMEYREGWGEIEATLVSDFEQTPRGGLGPRGMEPPGIDDVQRSASLRFSILDALASLDASFFSDLETILEGDPRIRPEADRRRRTTALDATGSGIPGFGGGADGVLGLDLAAIVTGSGDDGPPESLESIVEAWSADYTPLLEDRARRSIDLDRRSQLAEREMMTRFSEGGDAIAVTLTVDGDGDDDEIFRSMQAISRERSGLDRAARDAMLETVERIVGILGAEDGDAFRLECERSAWPRSFRDPRSPAANFERALGLEDLDESTRAAVKALELEWSTAWTAICRKLVAIERAEGEFDPFDPDQSFDPGTMRARQADRRRLRFERTELDERTFRDLRLLLTPGQQEIVGELPEARRPGLPGGLQLDLPAGFGEVEFIIGE